MLIVNVPLNTSWRKDEYVALAHATLEPVGIFSRRVTADVLAREVIGERVYAHADGLSCFLETESSAFDLAGDPRHQRIYASPRGPAACHLPALAHGEIL
jgi:hypothetical protein